MAFALCRQQKMRSLLLLAGASCTFAQLPVWHSPNYQCKDALAPWPVCKDPRALMPQYRQKAFPVWAWAGPWGYDSVTTTPTEMDHYAAANFNVAQVSATGQSSNVAIARGDFSMICV